MVCNQVSHLHYWKRVVVWIGLFSLFSLSTGCQSWFNRKNKDEDNQFKEETKRVKEQLQDPNRPRLIGEVAGVTGVVSRYYDSIGLVSSLPNTGGKVRPSMQRDLMLAEMRVRGVESPELVLDAPWTALTKVRVYSFPCYEDNQQVDVVVETSSECDATDLTGGILFEAKLREVATLGGKVKTSGDKAVAKGEVVILPESYTKKPKELRNGIVIGGGRLLQSHNIGLQMTPEYKHVYVVREIVKSLNDRFFFNDDSRQRMVAEGKSDSRIVITTIPKYKWDPSHFANVILASGFAETKDQQMQRLIGCEKLLKDRTTARRAAAELEALGTPEAIEVLLQGLSSIDTEIRFYSAYSLAYLGRKESVNALTEIAKTTPAFRPLCLTGLTINEQESARDALERLLQEPEPELRFGAFLAIRNRDVSDPRVQGEKLTPGVELHQIPSSTPLLAVSLQSRPELLFFGNSAPILLPSPINPTSAISITPVLGDQLKLNKRLSEEVASVVVPADTLSLLRGLGTIGASYNEFVHSIDQLNAMKCSSVPIAMNPRPMAGRIYKRDQDDSEDAIASVVSVDGATRPKEESSWWYVPDWFKRSSIAKKEKDAKTPVSAGETVSAIREPIPYEPTGSDVNSNDLPDIDWNEIK